MGIGSVGTGGGLREVRGLALLFGAIYFIQGVGEPGEGLIAQPVRSLLARWGHSPGEIAAFSAILSLPWVLKPLYGLLSDFVPWAGSRRRSYLLAASAATTFALLYLYLDPPGPGSYQRLLLILLLPTLGIAFSDVVADALMVEKGQPRGITGQLQSVQWGALYGATIVTGYLGGYLSEHHLQALGFLICATMTAGTGVLAFLFVREEPIERAPHGARDAWQAIATTLRSRAVWGAAAFLFLWNFNPFSSAVLYLHMTRVMGLGEQFYGNTVSLLAVAAVAASMAYLFYCRRIAFHHLVHGAIVAGIASTLAYWALTDETSALSITVFAGFTYMTGTLIQLDLAARSCPLQSAGTTFALLMAVSNLGYAASTAIGGHLYETWLASMGEQGAFDALVAVGALCTCACWLTLPWLRWQAAEPGAGA
ncbi:MAG: MFS transporter [Gammaproteobacteria bacterium]|nr:MFS transporter [Gammaproteobacteria bacterium]